MVMTFILHPLSHYNSIIETHARFLLSLIMGAISGAFVKRSEAQLQPKRPWTETATPPASSFHPLLLLLFPRVV